MKSQMMKYTELGLGWVCPSQCMDVFTSLEALHTCSLWIYLWRCPHVDVNPTGRPSFNWKPSEEEKLSAKGSLNPCHLKHLARLHQHLRFSCGNKRNSSVQKHDCALPRQFLTSLLTHIYS